MIIDNFLNYMSAKEVSVYTVTNYACDLRDFSKFISARKFNQSENIIFQSITLDDLHAYLMDMKKKELSKSTRSRRVACLKSLWKYLVKMKTVPSNIAEELETPKLDKKQPIYMTPDEARKLLDVAKGNVRDFCILTFFLNCGLRISELASIEIDKIKEDSLAVKGKGSKWRTIYLNTSCLSALMNYLKQRPKTKDSTLFLSRLNKKMTTRAIHDIVKKYITSAGLDSEKYSAHKLRHTCATLLYQYGKVDIRAIQEILGHSSLNTTQIYTHLNDDRLKAAVGANPLNVPLK